MLSGCSLLESIDLSHFITPKLEDISYMFSGCSSLTSLDFSFFDTKKLRYINSLFSNCIKLSYIDISTFHNSLNYENAFINLNNSGIIKINKNISIIIKTIFNKKEYNWEIIEN